MNFRCNKVSKEIKKVLSLNILNFSTLVTIIDVKVSPNLREASVFFSIFGPEELCQKTLQQLKANSSSLQYIVKKSLNIRHAPAIFWYFINNGNKGSPVSKIN